MICCNENVSYCIENLITVSIHKIVIKNYELLKNVFTLLKHVQKLGEGTDGEVLIAASSAKDFQTKTWGQQKHRCGGQPCRLEARKAKKTL